MALARSALVAAVLAVGTQAGVASIGPAIDPEFGESGTTSSAQLYTRWVEGGLIKTDYLQVDQQTNGFVADASRSAIRDESRSTFPQAGVPHDPLERGNTHAMADANVSAGVLRLFTSAWVDNQSWSTEIHATATSELAFNDSITLDKPATVTLTGRVHGTMSGFHDATGVAADGYTYSDGFVSARIGFWKWEGGETGYSFEHDQMYSNSYEYAGADEMVGGVGPVGLNVDDYFSYTLHLDAGTHYFSAYMSASVMLGATPGGAAAMAAAFDNTASFHLYVPEDVTVTSASGYLPISVPEPTSLSTIVVAGMLLVRRR